MNAPPNRSVEQLAEVLAALAASSTEGAAIQGAVERIAECFESEAGAVIEGGTILASIGFRRDGPVPRALVEVACGPGCEVVVPGAGRCRAVAVLVPSQRPCRLVLARSGDDGFSKEELSLLRSMGRILATALDMLHLRDRVADSESRFRRIVETANEGIWLLDAAGATTFANEKMAEILGYPPEEMPNLTLFDVVDEEGKPHAARNLERRRAGVSDQLECAFLRKDGTYVWVLLNASPLVDGDGGYVGSLCMVSDITPRKRIEDELAAARDSAMESSRLKSDFLATMSHEIRTPMNGVIGLTGLLLTTDLDERQRQYADGVRSAGEGLLAIINDILDLSKIEAGRLELEVIDFDLVQVVEEAAALVAAPAQRKGLELLSACAPGLPSIVRGDPARLRQVLLNLTSNAVKFTASGEVVIRAALVPSSDDSGDRVAVRFEVADTGIGISDEDGKRLFQAFSQADASTTRRFGGTGLGLVISRRLVSAMDGDLGFDSTPGRGSTFWFTLPLERGEALPGMAPPASAPPPGLRVLVVDDNESSRRILHDQLVAWGLACDLATDGPAALRLLQEAADAGRLHDVVLLDGTRAGMEGFELASRISSDPALAATRLVLLTSAAGIAAAHLRRVGISACLTKPVRLSQLALALDPSAPAPSRPPPLRSAPTSASGGHILVVEDNANNQLVAMGILRLLGYRADIAANGFEALEALARTDYDAILMDCQMPEMDGFTATGEIRRREGPGRHTPVIAMTAGASDADRDRCLAAGMDDFLAKPVRPGDVEAALARWVIGDPQVPAGGEAAPSVPQPVVQEPPPDRIIDDDLLAELAAIADGTLLTGIIDSFLGGTPRYLANLDHLVASGDAEAVRHAAHRLRGSSGTVGALEVTRRLGRLEELAAAGSLDGASDLLAPIVSAYERAAVALLERRGPDAPAPAPVAVAPTPTWITDGALQHLPEPALHLDAQGRLVEVNRLAATMCATTRTASPAVLAEAVLAVPGFGAWLGGVDDDAFRGRLQWQRENGVPLTLQVSAQRFPGAAGGATCLLLEFDHERVATEAQRYFDVAFDAAPIGMALFNTDGEYVRVNRALSALLGRAEGELLGHRDQEFTHPDDRQRDVDAAWRILRGEISTWQCEKRFVRPDGQLVWAIANLTFLRDADGNPVSWVGQFQDITDRESLETDLRVRQRQTRQIIDTANEAFVSIDEHDIVTDWNPRSEAMFGWRRDEILGRAFAGTLVGPGDRAAHLEALRRYSATGEGFVVVPSALTMLHRSGRTLQVEVTFSALTTDAGYVINGFLRDVSERKRAEQQLTQAHSAAIAASRLKSEFVANMSHEIRTPLNGVIGMTALLLDSDLSDRQREYADAARSSADDLLRVVDDVLDFAKIEAGKLEVESELFDVRELVADVALIVAPRAHAKGIDLAFWVDDTLPSAVRGDAGRIGQVLSNLLSNAVKFTASGEVVVEVRGALDVSGPAGVNGPQPNGAVPVRFEVRDSGIGIEPGALDRIFDSFSQADGSTTRRFGGTGLGLTISRQLVGLMGGSIGVESTPGEGSTFWFVIPLLADTDADAVPAPSGGHRPLPPAPGAAAVGRARGTVLVVEDNPINQLVAVSLLEARGFTVDVASNGLEALEHHGRRAYRAIFMDGHMPELDGYEATGEIRRREDDSRHTPIVALTAGATPEDRRRCLAAGMDDYLSKPVNQKQLDLVLERLIEGDAPVEA